MTYLEINFLESLERVEQARQEAKQPDTDAMAALLANPPPDLQALLQAAMLECDYYGDDAAAREVMRHDCATVEPHHRRALEALFRREYGNPHDVKYRVQPLAYTKP